jgi:hypothetical protein
LEAANLNCSASSLSAPAGLRLSHLPRQLVLPSLQRSGSRRIPATSADGYFRYIAESVVNADFTEAKRSRQDAKNKCCILLFIGYDVWKIAQEHFRVVSNYVNGE